MIRLIGLISPVIVPIIVAGILIFSSEKDNRPKIYLVFYMLIIAFVFAANYFYFEHNYRVYSWLHSLHIASVLMIYPGAFVYIRLLTNGEVKWKYLLPHFYPAFFFFMASALIFFPFLSVEERLYFLDEYRFHPDFTKPWLKLLYFVRMANIAFLFIQVFLYLLLIFQALKKHRKKMADIFSNPEKFQLNWLRYFNLALALSAFISVFLYAVNPAKLFGDDRFLSYPLLLIAVILWYLGVMGNNQARPEPVPEKEKECPDKPRSVLAESLERYFMEKKPFLKSDLKIWDVSAELGSNRTYISQLINQEYQKNFAAFVNSYRVEEARKILAGNPDIPLMQLADEVGFGSSSSLRRAFRQHFGKSISEFRK